MATLAREILTVQGMDVRLSVLSMSYVGISVAGTWRGTISFGASQADMGTSGPGGGAAFKPVGVFANPGAVSPTLVGGAATVVQSITANGNYFWPVQNYATFLAQLTTLTSGSPIVTLATSIDSSWADAFFPTTSRFKNSFANGAINLLTLAASANFGRRLRSLTVSAAPHVGGGAGTGSSSAAGPATASWGQNPILQIIDGSSVLWACDLPSVLPFVYEVPIPKPQTDNYGVTDGGIYFTPGNASVVQLASGGTGVTTNVNAEFTHA